MKRIIFAIFCLATLSGCQSYEPSKSNQDNDLLEVTASDKVLTASDVNIEDNYQFAVNLEAQADYDTYKPGTISITSNVPLEIYGSEQPITGEQLEDQNQVSLSTTTNKENQIEMTLEDEYAYYYLVTNEKAKVTVVSS